MITDLVTRITDKALGVARSLESLPPLLARLVVGVVFATSGWGKIHDLAKGTAYFTELRLNGEAVTEAEVNGLYAASLGVPVGLVSGDSAVCATALSPTWSRCQGEPSPAAWTPCSRRLAGSAA